MTIKALIVDYHAFFRQTLRTYLEAAGAAEVIGEAADGVEAIESVERLQPRMVIMDVDLPRLDGIKAAKAIKNRCPGLRLILYTVNSPELYMSLNDLRAEACLSKDRLFDDLLKIIQGVPEPN